MSIFHFSRLKCGRVKKLCVILLILSVFSTLLYMRKFKLHTKSSRRETKVSQTEYEKMELELLNYVIKERGAICEMPKLNPFSEEGMRFRRNVTKVTCPGVDWVKCYFSKCFVIKQILENMKDIVCTYRDIIYENDQKYFLETETKVVGNGTYKLQRSDHVRVSCSAMSNNGTLKMTDGGSIADLGYYYTCLRTILGLAMSLFAVALVIKISFLEYLLPVRWSGVAGGLREEPWMKTKPGFNVLVLAFGSTSHNGFRRHMPRSYQVLTEELNATIFKSYNILGEGTPAALFPLLTGKSELEHHEDRNKMTSDKIVDYRKFLFHTLNKEGYRTAYFEDMPWTFQQRFKGFQRQPADHYLRAMITESTGDGFPWWNKFNQRHCLGDIPQYRWMLNITGQFMQLEGKKFGFTMITDIGHEDFNMISAADEDVASFLRWFHKKGLLSDTLLIVVGNHGSRYSDMRKTYQGRIEERLPLLGIVMGENLQDTRPEATLLLHENSRVLTTAFDLHATILDVFGLKHLANNYTAPGSVMKRGISLFEHLPRSRLCGDAGILPFWCACAKWHNVSNSDPMYLEVANKLANFINRMTSKVRFKCIMRHLVKVKKMLHHRTNNLIMQDYTGATMESFSNVSRLRATGEFYQARIIMNPGMAEFEGSMVYYPKEKYFAISDTDISRTNDYGDESSCVRETHPELQKFCICS